MKQHIKNIRSNLSKWLSREDGSSTVEFVTIMPLAFAIFFASAESSIIILRKTFLDRAVEMTARDLRLGTLDAPTTDSLKTEICNRMSMVNDCATNLRIEFNVINTAATSVTIPSSTNICNNTASPAQPAIGAANQLVLLKVCLLADVVFPTTRALVPVGNPVNNKFQLISTTVYVNEPK